MGILRNLSYRLIEKEIDHNKHLYTGSDPVSRTEPSTADPDKTTVVDLVKNKEDKPDKVTSLLSTAMHRMLMKV